MQHAVTDFGFNPRDYLGVGLKDLENVNSNELKYCL